MSDVGFALEANSDQLNAVDIIGAEPILRIRDVKVDQGNDKPIWIYFDGDNNRPWKPSKGMLRILAGAWGRESSAWVGRHVQVYCDPEVMYAGEKVGGIRIKALSDIPGRGENFMLTINRKKRQPYHVEHLKVQQQQYPQDKFDKALPAMRKAMHSGDMTLQQVIAQCQKTGQLSDDQLNALEDAAPVEVDDESEEPAEAEQNTNTDEPPEVY